MGLLSFQRRTGPRRDRGAPDSHGGSSRTSPSGGIERDLEALRAGGDREEVFRRLHQRYRRGIHAFFARRGCSEEECRDLAQETFLRLCRGIATFRGRSRFETWLYEIAANVWRNEIRGRSAAKRDRPEVSLDAAPWSEDSAPVALESPERDPDAEALAKEQVALVRRGVETLPPRMRRCLQLRLDQELKFREIAVIEQVSIDTVKSQLAQARQRLRLELESHFGRGPAAEVPT